MTAYWLGHQCRNANNLPAGRRNAETKQKHCSLRARYPTKLSWPNAPNGLLRALGVSPFDEGTPASSFAPDGLPLASIPGLMGKVAGSINDIKPAKEM